MRNLSCKEKWVKGVFSGIAYLEKLEEEKEQDKLDIEKITKGFKKISLELLELLLSLENPTYKAQEEALKNRVSACKEAYELAKKTFGISSPEEQLDYNLRLLEYEKHKKLLTISSEKIELDLEKSELEVKKLKKELEEENAEDTTVEVELV